MRDVTDLMAAGISMEPLPVLHVLRADGRVRATLTTIWQPTVAGDVRCAQALRLADHDGCAARQSEWRVTA